MHVRKTTNRELIQRLDLEVFGADDSEDEYSRKIWWLAYVDGKIAGFAGLKTFKEGNLKCGFLCRTGVKQEYRGQGIQRALIDCRDREARRLGLDLMLTYTARDNYASANNLIRTGYTLYHPQCKWGLKDGLYFCKPFKYRRPNV